MIDATPLLRRYAAWRLRRLRAQKPETAQAAALKALLRQAAKTRFGRAHGFSTRWSVPEFQRHVPLRTYEDFWKEYWKSEFPRLDNLTWPGVIPYFAVTSGTTTGTTKYIPCTRAMIRSNEKAATDLLVHHVHNRPQSRVLAGRSFMLGGSAHLEDLAPGIAAGDLSGLAMASMPWYARLRYFPDLENAAIADWDEKIDALAPLSLGADLRLIGGIPSWLIGFFERVAAEAPGADLNLGVAYPNLNLLVHGGVNFAPYRRRFENLIAGTDAELREVYPASEGFFAIADSAPDRGLRLILDHGLFYEFVPLEEVTNPNPVRHWIANAETGVEYALAVSTCAGLWAYLVGDTVKLVSRDPPRVEVTGRTAYMLSAFGEHLIDSELEAAVAAAASAIETGVTDFAAGAHVSEEPGVPSHHVFIVEMSPVPAGAREVSHFAEILDQSLKRTNDDYRGHRAGRTGLGLPQVLAVTPGTFADWMRVRGQIGGQHKVPRIINDQVLLANLLSFVHENRLLADSVCGPVG